MNRGFKKYYNEGYTNAKETLKRKGNLCRYYLYVFISLLSYLFIFIKPVIDMAGVRLLKMVRADKEITVSKAISSSDNAKSYWTCMLAYIIKGLMILAIILVIGLLGFALAGIGYAIYSASAFSDELYNMPIFMMIPAIAILAIFIIALPMLTAPISYIVDTNPNMGASKVLFTSIDSLKKGGKKTLFLSYLVELLIKLIFILIPVGLYAYLYNNLLSEPDEVIGIMIAATILVTLADIIIYVFFMTKFIVGLKLSRIYLFEDLVLDNFNGAKRLTGIEFKEEKSEYKTKLERLFDYTEGSNKEANLLSQLREINATKVEEKDNSSDLSEEELLVLNSIPESDLSDMLEEREALELQIENAKSNDDSKEAEVEEIPQELNEIISNELEQLDEIDEPALENIEIEQLAIEDSIDENSNEQEDAIIENPEEVELDNKEANFEAEEAIVEEIVEDEISEESELTSTQEELTAEELELLNAIPSTEYDEDMKELMDELRAFEEMHQDLDDEEINALDEDTLFNNAPEALEVEFDPANATEAEIEEMLNEVGDDFSDSVVEDELSLDELDILNSIPDASLPAEEIVYVDEDGNPIEIADDEIITEEEIVYVDEDGNPVEVEEADSEESEALEFESFINSLDEQTADASSEKPKRGRRKKTEEGE